jgi:hypothetical protein
MKKIKIGDSIVRDCLKFALGCREKQELRHDRPGPFLELKDHGRRGPAAGSE